ncbi:MAG: peptidylprolyl isomerase [Oculatellaceae cyanobacterium bins.114]|nr:peptidylprolyl isomerase [Oculatellaceae cyanobacterium bins.114]
MVVALDMAATSMFRERTITITDIAVGNVNTENIISLLDAYGLLIPFLREVITDRAVQSIECNSIELADAEQQFCEQCQITDESSRQTWLTEHFLTEDQLMSRLRREVKIEKFKRIKWRRKLESYFLQRKDQLDQVIYSLIRTKDLGIAEELFFRLEAGEQSFSELASRYSQGPEAQTGGIVGPVSLEKHHPSFAHVLRAYPKT